MKIIGVDDEQGALRVLGNAIRLADKTAEVNLFDTAPKALAYCQEHGAPDVAFLDIRIGGSSGLDLARDLQNLDGSVNIIFVTGYSEYAVDAIDIRVSGYLLKPVTALAVRKELESLRNPVLESRSGVYIRAFGDFEVFIDGAPVHFRYDKTKELLAYLFDRQGALCSNSAISVVLWEDEGHGSYFRQLRKDLIDALDEKGYPDVVVRLRGKMGLNMDKISSDFQDWKRGMPSALNAFQGEYMSQYSWAEATAATLY